MEKLKKESKKNTKLSDFELAEIYQSRVLLVKIDGKLHCFNQKHFQVLDKQDLETSVLETLREELKHDSINRVSAVARVLRTQGYPDYLDGASEGWLGFANGIWNVYTDCFYSYPLYRNNLIPITYCLENVSYYQAGYLSPTPQLDLFFDHITGGNSDLIQRIWEMLGYILTPDTKAKAFFVLQGVPHSGKSILGRFLESYFPQGKVTSLDISRLGGQFLPDAITESCLNLSMDLPDKPLSPGSVANIKMITGGDLSTQEAKYKDAKSYRSHCKLLFSTNHSLKMREKDPAFLERIVCIPFRYSVSRQEQDTELLPKLLYEKEAAAMKALRYYKELQKNQYQFSGTGTIYPDIDYQLKPQEMIREFVEEKCVFVPYEGGGTYSDDLYNAFVAFCKKNGYRQPMEIIGFSRTFSAMYAGKVISDKWRNGKRNLNGYRGVILTSEESDDDDGEDGEITYYIDGNGNRVLNV